MKARGDKLPVLYFAVFTTLCYSLRSCARRKSQEETLAFSEDCMKHVVEAYCPIVKKHMNDAYTPEQKQWQAMRRGRYVEFNLVYDR